MLSVMPLGNDTVILDGETLSWGNGGDTVGIATQSVSTGSVVEATGVFNFLRQ